MNENNLKAEIAKYLGDEWTISGENISTDIVLKNDPQCGIFLSFSHGPKPKVSIGGLWRMGLFGNSGLKWEETSRSINISTLKPPISIATEIKRRFLPKYFDLYQRNVDVVSKQLLRQSKINENKKMIEAELSLFKNLVDKNRGPQIEVREIGPETVTMQFSNVSMELAKNLIKTMRGGGR